jgi:hypothetical protein
VCVCGGVLSAIYNYFKAKGAVEIRTQEKQTHFLKTYVWLDWATIQFRFIGPSSFNTQYCITIGSETTFLSALCVIRSPCYFLWPRTFLLGAGLTDLGHFGRYFGQNKEIVSVFNGSVVCFDVGIGLTFLGRCCSTFQELYFQQLFFEKYSGRCLDVVQILCPEVNLRPAHGI